MNKYELKTFCKITLLVCFSLSLFACGGGGGGGKKDTTAPTVSSATPADKATGVARNSAVTATFDENIFATTVDATSFTLASSMGKSVAGTVSFDATSNVATFTPSSDLALLTNYTASLSTAITDLAGNPLASAYQWSFTTADGAWGTVAKINTDNTSGHNAYQPDIKFDTRGNAIAVWYQDRIGGADVWARRYDAATSTWGTAVIISDGVSGEGPAFPRIGIDANGDAIVTWYQSSTSLPYQVWANRYDANTDSWGTATDITSDTGHNAFNPEIGIDAKGNAIAVWSQSDGTTFFIWANRYDATTKTWGTAAKITADNTAGHAANYPQIAVDTNGNMIVVWSQTDGTTYFTWANRYDAGTNSWGTAAPITSDNVSGHDASKPPQIAVDANGNMIAVWQQSDGTTNFIWANRYDATTHSWGTAAKITSDNLSGHDAEAPQVEFDASGNAIAVWDQTDGKVYTVRSNRYDATTGTWGTAATISSDNTAGHDAARSQIGLDAGGNAIAVWQQSDGTTTFIWANRYDATTGSWGTATTITSDNASGHNAAYPEIGIAPNGNAMATWFQSDGTTDFIWVNPFQ